MLNTGIFPDLKIAKISPIYKKKKEKKDDETKFSNYRPISLLPAISKIFEKIISTQTYEYFTKQNYFIKANIDLEMNTQLNMLHFSHASLSLVFDTNLLKI